MGHAGLISSQGLIGGGRMFVAPGLSVAAAVIVRVRGRQCGGALIGTCQREMLARSPRADGSPIVLGC